MANTLSVLMSVAAWAISFSFMSVGAAVGEEALVGGVPVGTLCLYEKRMFDDARAAERYDGDANTLTPQEREYRESLLNRLRHDFKQETEKDFDEVWGVWTLYVVSKGNPCR
jgi:hypothetical protein